MSFTTNDYKQLQKLMDESPENKELLQKLLDSHQFTISKISHEIRNPLTLIYSTFQLIEAQHPEVKSFNHWDQMREDLEYMSLLLTDLSAYNNSERLRKESFPATDFFKRICLSFAASCAETNIEFTSHVPAELGNITGDKIKLQEVFLNLLKNAKEAISSHAQGFIYLDASTENGILVVQIRDNGCGIAPEDLDTIFDAFVTHKGDGTGLGLAIVQKTLLAHNGNISVISTLHKGTTFTIQLPIT